MKKIEMEKLKEKEVDQLKNNQKLHLVKEIRHLTDSTYVIGLDKNDIHFIAGQYMTVGLAGSKEMREYSIYSGEHDDRLEFLIKEVEEGDVSKWLKKVKPGDFVAVDGPFGFFSVNRTKINSHKHLFVASGTGISPFHSYVRSYKKMDYRLVHGIRKLEEAYGKNDYADGRYISCTSRDSRGHFHGRVTDYLRKNPVDKQTLCYLCGNSNMIYDVFDVLRSQGVPSENVHMEVYF